MKKPLSLFFLVVGLALSANAQDVQWASKVLEFSSELTPVQYSARQVLGKPNVLPAGGQSPNAWSPDRPKRREFLKVGFETPMRIRQIAIAESHNPSAIYRVLVYDEAGREYLINTLNPRSIPLKGRMLNLFVEETPYKVAAVKVEFDGGALPDYFGIDAIAISNVTYPIIADIPKLQLLRSGLVVEALNENVNSNYDELNPLLSPDGKTLYFSRRNHPDNIGGKEDREDIWYSELDANGNWSLAKNMGTELNNAEPNFINSIQSVTPDGRTAVILLGNQYLDNGKMRAGLSLSTNAGGVWSKPVPVMIDNDYNFSEKANYFLSNTRTVLLMSVERQDSYGDRDLYVSFLKPDSSWTEPLNLGDIINTAAEESAPFLAADNKTLYFSSNGFSGYGGSDIYVSTRLDDTWTNWSDPENLGPEINSPLEDLFFNIPAASDYAYYSRGVSETNMDIFRVKLPIQSSPDPWVIVRGKVVDETDNPLQGRITFFDIAGIEESYEAESNPETGEYEIRVPGGKNYFLSARGPDGLSMSRHRELDLSSITYDEVIENVNHRIYPHELQAVELEVEENVSIVLNNIFFDFDKAILKPESFAELDRLVNLLKERQSVEIEIAGHTDAIGPKGYNLKLSERRAASVAKYLVDNGIDEKRISVVFFGASKPIAPNTTLEGRRKNRRVEFKALKL